MADKTPYAEIFKGTVVSSRRWSETHFEVAGRRNAPRFYTDIDQRQEIFVRDAHGNETRWHVPPDQVGFREGSNFIAVTGKESEDHDNLVLYVTNPDSGEVYNPPTPVRDKISPFEGFGLGFFVALILSVIVMLAAPALGKNSVGEFTSTKASFLPDKDDIKACPFGTRVFMDRRKVENDVYGCPPGAKPGYPILNGCECAKSSEDFANKMYAKAKENHENRLKSAAASYTFNGVIAAAVIGLIVWFFKYQSLTEIFQAKAAQQRRKFADAIIIEGSLRGVGIEVTDVDNLKLRRVTS